MNPIIREHSVIVVSIIFPRHRGTNISASGNYKISVVMILVNMDTQGDVRLLLFSAIITKLRFILSYVMISFWPTLWLFSLPFRFAKVRKVGFVCQVDQKQGETDSQNTETTTWAKTKFCWLAFDCLRLMACKYRGLTVRWRLGLEFIKVCSGLMVVGNGFWKTNVEWHGEHLIFVLNTYWASFLLLQL